MQNVFLFIDGEMMTTKSIPLFGLVLAGGKSSRMGQDKSQLVYFQKPQFQTAYELLEHVCAQVFVSSRLEQSEKAAFGNYPLIVDFPQYQDKGPLGGILSAMKTYPQAAWFVLACDLPFVCAQTLRHLTANRDLKAIATAFRSEHDGLPEPLCAVWEPGHIKRIEEFGTQGIQCPRKILIKSNAHLCDIQIKGELDNINSPQEAAQAKMRLNG